MFVLLLQSSTLNPVVWNSLEIAKLIVSTLTPIAVAIIGIWISRHLKRVEHLQWANQKIIERRLQVYAELAPILNDLYCYFDYIGDWKWKDPVTALGLKRIIDRLFYVNAPLFSKDLTIKYENFIDLCFIPGPLDEYDSTALLKTDINTRKKMYAKAKLAWDTNWDNFFARSEDVTPRDEIIEGYWFLMHSLSQELKAN
jgi:hypothetical protein